jgi:hypothetical protein
MTLRDSVVVAEFEQGAIDDVRRLKRKVTQRCDRKRRFENEGVAAVIFGITQGYAAEPCVTRMELIRAQEQNDRPEASGRSAGRDVAGI